MPGPYRRIDEPNVNQFVVTAPPPPKAKAKPAAGAAPTAPTFDPGEHTVDDVKAYAARHPDQLAAIVAAETAGKGRITLLEALTAE
jgi:hypothetical protein